MSFPKGEVELADGIVNMGVGVYFGEATGTVVQLVGKYFGGLGDVAFAAVALNFVCGCDHVLNKEVFT